MHQNGTWKWEKISFELPRQIVDRIQAIHIQAFGDKEDSLMWKLFPDGEFNVASAYLLAIVDLPKPLPFTDCWFWKLDTLPKIKHFFWLCNHRSVPVKQVIKERGINCNGLCPLCSVQEETILHVLRDCPAARRFWLSMGVPQALNDFLSLDLMGWLKHNCLCSSSIHANGLPWNAQFPFAVWLLWKQRNKAIFENSPLNPKLKNLCIQTTREYFYCVSKGQKIKRQISIQVTNFYCVSNGLV